MESKIQHKWIYLKNRNRLTDIEDKHHYQRGKGERDKGGVWASLVAQMVKNLPAIRETQVWSLGWEDPLEKGMATHSSILAWRIPRTEEPGRLQSMGSQRVGHDWETNTFTFRAGEGGRCRDLHGLERGLEGALDWSWSDGERKGVNDGLQASSL